MPEVEARASEVQSHLLHSNGRPAWATQDPVSKTQTDKRQKSEMWFGHTVVRAGENTAWEGAVLPGLLQ